MGRPREAEPVLVEAESRLSKVFGPTDPRVVGLNRTLADLYDKLGSPEKAASSRQKASPPPAPEDVKR